MSTNQPAELDPEDMFNDTRMSFGDHIEDLRTHLLRALKGFLIGMVLGLWPCGPFMMGVIVAPLEDQLLVFEQKKLNKDKGIARGKIADSQLSMAPIRVNIELRETNPEVLTFMMLEFEGIVRDLGAHEALSDELKNELKKELPLQNRSKKYVALIDPLPFMEQVLDNTVKIRRPRVSTMGITEAFFIYFKIAMYTGLVLSSPWVFYHIWAFVAAGLYPNEKKLVNLYLPFSLSLFLGGVFLCQFAVMPKAVQAMLMFNEWFDLDATLRLEEWLSFALLMPIVFGLSFQTPLLMMFAHKIGFITVDMYREKRRVAWFGMSIFAAVITPTPDPVSMLYLWVPMGLLYELGILLCVYQGGEDQGLAEWELEDQRKGELVEV